MAGSPGSPLQPARSASAKDLFRQDLCLMTPPPPPSSRCGSVDPQSRSPSPETSRCKGRTCFSARMSSGTGMRQALSHSPDSFQSPRRVSSVPRLLQLGEESPSGSEGSLRSRLNSVRSVDSLFGSPAAASVQSARSSLRRTRRSSPSECQSTLTGYGERSHNSSMQASPCLHGFGEVVGARGKSSVGVPFRHIPSYNGSGQMCQTGDRMPQTPQRAGRKIGMFSPRLSPGNGVKDLLAPVRETAPYVEMSVPEKENVSTTREAWLETVKRRAALAKRRPLDDDAVSVATSIPSSTLSSRPQDRCGLHHVYRAPKKGISLDFNTKDTCPYDRSDSDALSRTVQPLTPQKRTKPVSACSSPQQQQQRDLLSPEPVAWARRDFKFQQELSSVKVRQSSPFSASTTPSSHGSPRSLLFKSFSQKSLHSAREDEKPRWR